MRACSSLTLEYALYGHGYRTPTQAARSDRGGLRIDAPYAVARLLSRGARGIEARGAFAGASLGRRPSLGPLGSSAACHFIDLGSRLKHMDRRSHLDQGRVCILSAIRFGLQYGARIGLQVAPAHSGQTNERLGHRVPLTFVRSRR